MVLGTTTEPSESHGFEVLSLKGVYNCSSQLLYF